MTKDELMDLLETDMRHHDETAAALVAQAAAATEAAHRHRKAAIASQRLRDQLKQALA